MDHATDFRFLAQAEFEGLSLDEKLAYVDLLCAEVVDSSGIGAGAPSDEPLIPPARTKLVRSR